MDEKNSMKIPGGRQAAKEPIVRDPAKKEEIVNASLL